MFRNYFKTAWRNMKRNKVNSIINISGLAITISWWIFGAAGLLMIAVAFITLSFQTIKAAIANPVKSLRTE